MEFCVTRISGGMVAPLGEKVSSGMLLQLSVIDTLHVLRCNARTLHVYRNGQGAAQVIRAALSKALIPYYPLAGRLRTTTSSSTTPGINDDEVLQIECSGEGIWFVEASADCTLDAVNYFEDNATSIPYDKLLPPPTPQDPLVQMQVTQFECGGFVIGLIFCHSVCDGLGAAQFLNAVGEIARGSQQLTITPHWCRDFLPIPNNISTAATRSPPPPIPSHINQLEHASIDISFDRIKQLKRDFQESTGGMTCSTFELVAALLWRQRTRAIAGQQSVMRLVFFANCRQLIKDPPLPKGFYGNCFFPVSVTAGGQELVGWSTVEVVKLIQQAKAGLANQFAQWAASNYSGPDPFAPPLEYTTLFISEWGRLGFNEVDYGWGGPVHVVPIQGSTIIPVGILCTQPTANNSSDHQSPRGVRLMTWCVNKHHLNSLIYHMTMT